MERQKGEVRIQLHFESSMGIRPILLSEEEFQEINILREYSLLKYYNTASKSRYTFICQNVLHPLPSSWALRISTRTGASPASIGIRTSWNRCGRQSPIHSTPDTIGNWGRWRSATTANSSTMRKI
jgi:hypothetical protein